MFMRRRRRALQCLILIFVIGTDRTVPVRAYDKVETPDMTAADGSVVA
jgi:hypothetical protein